MNDYKAIAENLELPAYNLIDGKRSAAASGKTFYTIDPASGIGHSSTLLLERGKRLEAPPRENARMRTK